MCLVDLLQPVIKPCQITVRQVTKYHYKSSNWKFSSTIAAKSLICPVSSCLNKQLLYKTLQYFKTFILKSLRILSSWVVPHFKWEVLTEILWLWLLSHGLITRPLPVTISERQCGTQHGSRPADRPCSLLKPHFLSQKAPSTFLSGLPPLPWQLPPWCGWCLRL